MVSAQQTAAVNVEKLEAVVVLGQYFKKSVGQQRQVDAAFGQFSEHVFRKRSQPKVHFRCRFVEHSQNGTQDHHNRIVGRSNRQRTGDFRGFECLAFCKLSEIGEDAIDNGNDRSAFFRGCHALVVADKEFVAEFLLALAKRAADGRNC